MEIDKAIQGLQALQPDKMVGTEGADTKMIKDTVRLAVVEDRFGGTRSTRVVCDSYNNIANRYKLKKTAVVSIVRRYKQLH